MNTTVCTSSVLCRRPFILLSTIFVLGLMAAAPSPAQERMYFPAVDNVTSVLVQTIRAETVRIDMAAWYLTDGLIISALLQKHAEGVPIRLIGDRGSIFEIDRHTKNAFYRLANAGVPIRLRFNPAWYPEIVHWKATIFAGQNLVTFGSANYTPFELAPSSSTNYKDETVLFTDDSNLVNAFRTQFDRMWNDTTREPMSRIGDGPYFLDWNVACAREAACADYATLYPEPAPMHIDTARLEADHPMPADMTWGQGPIFNNRLAQEIENESNFIDFVIYRLTVSNITDALLARHSSGVPVRLIIEPQEYRNRKWSEFWLTHAYVDKLWAAGVPIKKRVHNGLTHMKMLVTSAVATNASSNLAASWQRDHNYFVPAQHKPAIYGAMKSRFDTMWNDSSAFAAFMPEPPDAPVLASPAVGASGVSTTTTLVWNRAAFATRYDVYLGASPSSMAQVATVNAALVNDPPETYSWQPSGLDASTTYYWKSSVEPTRRCRPRHRSGRSPPARLRRRSVCRRHRSRSAPQAGAGRSPSQDTTVRRGPRSAARHGWKCRRHPAPAAPSSATPPPPMVEPRAAAPPFRSRARWSRSRNPPAHHRPIRRRPHRRRRRRPHRPPHRLRRRHQRLHRRRLRHHHHRRRRTHRETCNGQRPAPRSR